MSDIYSLNPQILPSTPIPNAEHRRTIIGGVVALVILILIGLAYWQWNTRQEVTAPSMSKAERLKAEMAAALMNSRVEPLSKTEIDSMAAQLSKSRTDAVTATQREAMAAQLRRSSQTSF